MMKSFSKLLIFLSVASIYWAQSNAIPNPTSDINFNLKIPLKVIEKEINQNVPHTLVEDTSFTDNHNDNLKTLITKAGTIKVSRYNDYMMQVSIPLKVEAEKRIGAMGVYTSEKFRFKINMICLVSGEIDFQGKLATQTQIAEIEFEENPYLHVAGMDIPIAPMVRSQLEENKTSYAKSIDESIHQNIPLDKVLLQLLQYFSQPYKASDEYNAWIDFECQKMQYTPFQIQEGMLHSQINLVSYLKMYLAQDSIPKTPVKYLPYIEKQYLLPTNSSIRSRIFIPFTEATRQAQESMAGKDYSFQDGKYKLHLDSIQIGNNEEKLQFTLHTSGDFTGTIRLSGNPAYDSISHTIYLHSPQFQAKSKNLLYQTALWIKKRSIQNQIEKEYGFPVEENLSLIEESINQYLNTTYYNTIFLKGKTQKFLLTQIATSDYGISLYYDLDYVLDIELKELKSF